MKQLRVTQFKVLEGDLDDLLPCAGLADLVKRLATLMGVQLR